MTGEELKKKRRAVGVEQTELAEALGINPHTVSRWERGDSKILKKHWDNIDGCLEELSDTREIRACIVCGADISHKISRAIYCSKKCNNSASNRKKHRSWEEWLEVQKERGQKQRLITALKQPVQSLINVINKKIDYENKKFIVECSECGEEFYTVNKSRLTCSDECSKARRNRRKDTRINDSNLVDRDISLDRLYQRDGGKCYICGKECDYEDYSLDDNGYFTSGPNYPSIDHIIPIARGGMHAWDNVKLAHHYCNSLKVDALPSEFFDEPIDIDIDEAYALARKVSPNKKEVKQYTRDGKLIAIYESTAEASRQTGIKVKGIQKCARDECPTYKGYVWEY